MTKREKTLLSTMAVVFALGLIAFIALWQYLRRRPAREPVPQPDSPSTKRNIPIKDIVKLVWAIAGVVRQIIELKQQMT